MKGRSEYGSDVTTWRGYAGPVAMAMTNQVTAMVVRTVVMAVRTTPMAVKTAGEDDAQVSSLDPVVDDDGAGVSVCSPDPARYTPPIQPFPFSNQTHDEGKVVEI